MTFLACAHMPDATQLMRCSCTHVRCYATDGVGWRGLGGMITFFRLAHMFDAMQLMGWGGEDWGGMITFFGGR